MGVGGGGSLTCNGLDPPGLSGQVVESSYTEHTPSYPITQGNMQQVQPHSCRQNTEIQLEIQGRKKQNKEISVTDSTPIIYKSTSEDGSK